MSNNIKINCLNNQEELNEFGLNIININFTLEEDILNNIQKKITELLNLSLDYSIYLYKNEFKEPIEVSILNFNNINNINNDNDDMCFYNIQPIENNQVINEDNNENKIINYDIYYEIFKFTTIKKKVKKQKNNSELNKEVIKKSSLLLNLYNEIKPLLVLLHGPYATDMQERTSSIDIIIILKNNTFRKYNNNIDIEYIKSKILYISNILNKKINLILCSDNKRPYYQDDTSDEFILLNKINTDGYILYGNNKALVLDSRINYKF